MEFYWRGQDSKGQKVDGMMTAETLERARATLYRQGIRHLRLQRKVSGIRVGKAFTDAEVAAFLTQLTALIKAGVTVADGMHFIALNQRNSDHRNSFLAIHQDLCAGMRLCDALSKQGKLLEAHYLALLEVGEESATLATVLHKISLDRNRRMQLHKAIRSALLYPIIVFFVAIAVVISLLVFVLPQMQMLFTDQVALPWLTRQLLQISDWLLENSLLKISISLLLILLPILLFHVHATSRALMDRIFLRLPLLGGFLRQSELARINRMLAIQLGAGTPLLEAVRHLQGICQNHEYRTAMVGMATELGRGKRLAEAMSDEFLFPLMQRQMIANGEESGRLIEMLDHLAGLNDAAIERSSQTFGKMLEPAVMLFLGLVVACIVLAMYLPIFQLATGF